MKRTVKVVLVYVAVIALGWVEMSWGAEVDGDQAVTTAPAPLVASEAAAPARPDATAYVAAAGEPNWSPIVIPRGDYRDHIKSMPIEDRPYRPLHFYGNTIRRNHYRGNPLPMPRDLSKTATELIRRR